MEELKKIKESDLDWYIHVNEPRIKTTSDWEKIIIAEIKNTEQGYFDFINNVLIKMYYKPNHLIFGGDFMEETKIKNLNILVGQFRDRVHKIIEFPNQPRDDKTNVDRAWNIPFKTDPIANKKNNKFSWILRDELVEALENIYPHIKVNFKNNDYVAFDFSDFSLQDKPVKEIKITELGKSKKSMSSNINLNPKQDHEKINKIKKKIGDFGERKVKQIEQERLCKIGKKDLAELVKIVDSDGYGYDIISFDEQGIEKHIEVKTSKNATNSVNFYISSFEIEQMKKDPLYELHYLCNLKGEEIHYVRFSHKDLLEIVLSNLVPTQYYVNL